MFRKWLIGVASLFLVTPVTWAESYLHPGFVMERWLTNAGDLRGVTVGPGGDFGTDPFVVNRDLKSVLRVTGKDSFEVFASGLSSGTGRIAFDPSGSFGGDMFVSNPFDMVGNGDPIYRISSAGATSPFFQSAPGNIDLLMKGIAFGGGSGFGNDLYVMDAESQSLQRFTPSGSRTLFGSSVTSGSWEDDLVISPDGVFGNYAYMTDGMHHKVLQMAPNGVTTEFAAVDAGMSLALGEGAFGDYLYCGNIFGDIYAVDADGNKSLFASGFGIHSPEGNFRGMDIAGNVMWLTSDDGSLYRISPVPEPASLVLWSGLSVMGLIAARRRKRTA